MMGRPQKPIEMSKKNYTDEEKCKKEQAQELVTVGKEQLKRSPKWLTDKLATTEFKRIVKEFSKIDVIGNLDLNNIACYCNAYSMYRKATEQLADEDLIVEKPLPNGAIVMSANPLIKIQKLYAEEMRKFGGKCGLDIDSRLKAATVQTTTAEIDIGNEFGDI